MPGAQCTRSLAWEKIEPHELVTAGLIGNARHPHAMVLTSYLVLSPVTGFVATVVSVMRSIIANLTPASGRQDHTT